MAEVGTVITLLGALAASSLTTSFPVRATDSLQQTRSYCGSHTANASIPDTKTVKSTPVLPTTYKVGALDPIFATRNYQNRFTTGAYFSPVGVSIVSESKNYSTISGVDGGSSSNNCYVYDGTAWVPSQIIGS